MSATRKAAATDAAARERRTYSAFISYSRETDATLAPMLEDALERFAKPWNRLRALNVFRDDAELSANPGLWASIVAALDDSEFLVLLASPAAAGSTWVTREVEYWRAHRGVNELLLVVTDGEVVWEQGAHDFDWARTTALPEALRAAFSEEPRHVDLRWAHGLERLTLDDDRFSENVADLAATLHGRPKADMIGEQVRQHRRTIRLARGAIVVLSVTTVAALTAAGLAVWQRRVATDQRDSARARELAARADAALDVDPVVAVRLAAAGLRLKPLPEAERALRAALADSRLGTTTVLRGHRAPVFGAVFDRSGTRVVTASDDGTARVWNAATGATLVVLRGKPGATGIAVFDPRGRRVVTGGPIGVLQVWDAVTGRRLLTLRGGPVGVNHVEFDPQGRRILAAAERGAHVWDAATGKLLRVVDRPGHAEDASFSPDGTRIVSGGLLGGAARIWDAATGKLLATLPGNPDGVRRVFYDATGTRILILPWGGAARVWQADGTGRPTLVGVRRGSTTAAVFDATGSRVATAGGDGTVRIWDASTGRMLAALQDYESAPTSIAFDPAGRRVLGAAADGKVWIWDVASGEVAETLDGHENAVLSAEFDPTGTRVVTAGRDGTARAWDVPELEAPVLRAGEVAAAAFDRDGARLVTGGVGGPALVWDTATWRRVAESHGGPRLVFTADGAAEVADGSDVKQVPVGALAVDSTGSLVAIQGLLRTVIRDRASGRTISTLRHPAALASSPYTQGSAYAAFSPDGTRIVTLEPDGTAIVWVPRTGRQVAVLRGHDRLVYSAVFDPTGTRVVTTGLDGTARIWNAATGETEAVLPAASRPTVFDARGELLVTLGPHGTARVWEAATGERLAVLRDSEPIRSAAISPDGRFVVTVGSQGTVRVHTCRACGPVGDLLGAAALYPRAEVPASLRSAASRRTAVLGRVREVVAEGLGLDPGEVREDATLRAGLGADSLDELELVMELEDTFGITIPDEACALLHGWTVGEIADYVAARA